MSLARLNTRRFGTRRSRGAVLICVIVCLAVATLLLATMLKRTLQVRRQLRTERNARQTEWLAQAGAERAAFRLSDPDYEGERWMLPADAIVGSDPGVVSISVGRNSADQASVEVVAEYPSESVFSIRRTRKFLIDLPQNE